MATKKAKWELIGEVGVDGGMLMISDPCYVIGEHSSGSIAFPTWESFIEGQREEGHKYQLRHQMDYAHGAPGLGVVAGTAHGDGLFKVYALKDDDTDRTQAMLVITGDMDPPV
jgi:hypothetical protein